ncbi:hypothetical protein GGP41_001566 [Bipolaris sorokiniana]|uniref:Uncharacterized protein n=1 Tax=Cochliobolus sativus TaxID=45130 RepID=A0A8H6DYV6_COCSA|nr:hypothetical protein GGP41_001566 [Bipolaris sorokiniana]
MAAKVSVYIVLQTPVVLSGWTFAKTSYTCWFYAEILIAGPRPGMEYITLSFIFLQQAHLWQCTEERHIASFRGHVVPGAWSSCVCMYQVLGVPGVLVKDAVLPLSF